MQMAAGWEFSDKSPRPGLCLGDKAVRRSRPAGCRRQSPGVIFMDGLRLLPLYIPAAALLWRLAVFFLPADFAHAVPSGVIIAASAALLSTVWALVSWLCCKWELSNGHMIIRRGVITRREVSIDPGAIISVGVERTPLTALAGAARLRISTAEKQRDQLVLRRAEASLLAAQLLPSAAGRSHRFRADGLSLWLAAVGGEGLVAFYSAAAPLLSAISDLSGRLLENRLTALVEQKGIIISGTLILTLVWLSKILHTRITHAKMSASTFGSVLTLHRGVISHRVDRLTAPRICAFDTRISLPGLALGRQSCRVLLPGEGSFPLLPAVSNRRLRIETATIAPHGAHICTVRPVSSGVTYAAGRWLAGLAPLPLFSLLRRLMPAMSATIPVLGATVAVLLIWRALITTVSAHRAGLVVFTDCAELTGVRFFSLHTLRVFRQSAGIIRITQSPLSRLLGRCTLHITPRGNRPAKLSSIKLPLDRVLAVCERMM